MSERLNKHIALQLGISRREADNLIQYDHVRVNGEKVMLGARFEKGDTITVKNKPLASDTAFVYLAMNKPIGYVCSRKQQGDAPTIYSLLPKHYHTLKPVGRLDKESSGLILLTNDGDFTYQMTHPKFFKTKIYQISLDAALAPIHQQLVADHGIQLEDGPSKLVLERSDDTRKHWIVTMHEGRNRQIRRTFNALGYRVTKLHRTNFGHYSLGDIQPGTFSITEKL
ncbi:MAG: rRNA pseudouridine synthase [Candidatus Microsaccharimonas sossegonensis]|uniref:Pseudouridine synthase n=1 Tax=Candidatus Microsaccharimonas sossegonensis TaxID=2506948 RepID=A0A4Q0AI18_9BACT|nr:MAG: rRNA pseudouridine synthase [Candidatus Microsaccharimonas sossegonensis]